MKEIGRLQHILATFLLLFLISSISTAQTQDVSVTASVNVSSVVEGSDFLFSIEISGRNLSNIQRPELHIVDGIQQISGFPSTSTSFSIINGVTTSTYGYRFTMRAIRAGEFTIPAINVQVGNETYTSNPVTITVNARGQSRPQDSERDEEVFLRVELSNNQPFSGQQISANVVLFFKDDVEIVSYQPSTSWRTEGFWVENITDPRASPRAEAVIINGIRYRKATLLNYVLIPTRSGRLNLGTFSVRANVRPSFRNTDPFRSFQSSRNQRSVQLESPPVELSVRSLPGERPQNFSGAVGQFNVTREISDVSIMVGEPIEIITTFTGSGNIALINQPNYDFAAEFDMFAPRENQQTEPRNGKISGTKTFTNVLIPRQPGNFEIPATTISWFDDAAQRYQTRNFPAFSIQVNRDPNEVFSTTEVASLTFRPVTGIVSWRPLDQTKRIPGFIYIVLIITPFILVGLAWFRKNYLDKLKNDPAFYRLTYANENALKRLEKGKNEASQGNWKEAYLILYKAFSIYIADRLNLSETGNSDSEILSRFEQLTADATLKENVRLFLTRCTTISYAPGAGEASFDDDFEFISNTINKLNDKNT